MCLVLERKVTGIWPLYLLAKLELLYMLESQGGLIFLQVRIAVFSQHHVDGLDLSSNPLLYMMRCYPVSPCYYLLLFFLYMLYLSFHVLKGGICELLLKFFMYT